MRKTALCLTLLALAAGSAAPALAQGVPTTQPKFMHVFREQIKPGRSGEHAKWEAGWPAAYEKAKSPYHYIALQSITGPSEVWYVVPLANHAAYGEMVATEDKDPALAAELERLNKGDAEFRAEESALQAVAMPDLSHGAFPAPGKMKYYEITTFRIRDLHHPGQVHPAAAQGFHVQPCIVVSTADHLPQAAQVQHGPSTRSLELAMLIAAGRSVPVREHVGQ